MRMGNISGPWTHMFLAHFKRKIYRVHLYYTHFVNKSHMSDQWRRRSMSSWCARVCRFHQFTHIILGRLQRTNYVRSELRPTFCVIHSWVLESIYDFSVFVTFSIKSEKTPNRTNDPLGHHSVLRLPPRQYIQKVCPGTRIIRAHWTQCYVLDAPWWRAEKSGAIHANPIMLFNLTVKTNMFDYLLPLFPCIFKHYYRRHCLWMFQVLVETGFCWKWKKDSLGTVNGRRVSNDMRPSVIVMRIYSMKPGGCELYSWCTFVEYIRYLFIKQSFFSIFKNILILCWNLLIVTLCVGYMIHSLDW
jgi:hypothetical protein